MPICIQIYIGIIKRPGLLTNKSADPAFVIVRHYLIIQSDLLLPVFIAACQINLEAFRGGIHGIFRHIPGWDYHTVAGPFDIHIRRSMSIKSQGIQALISKYMFPETVGYIIFIVVIGLVINRFQKTVLAFQVACLCEKRLIQYGFLIDT